MVTLKIDNRLIAVSEKSTILEASALLGIKIPTLCYLKELNEIGACKVCVVEVAGFDRLVSACNTYVEEGMVIYTNSLKVRKSRYHTLQLILANHDMRCPICDKNGRCQLQNLCKEYDINSLIYPETYKKRPWNKAYPLIRDSSKCINCLRCVQVCDKTQGIKVWDLIGTGSKIRVDLKDTTCIEESKCVLCGQCIAHCPVGALQVRSDNHKFYQAIDDPNKICVVQIAPAIRTSFDFDDIKYPKQQKINLLVDALKKMGVDYVFDTNFSADLTIMEEGHELIKHLSKEQNYPLFTSCCPGWVNFVKKQHPDLLPYLSSAKSPQQMFGALSKTYLAKRLGVAPSQIYTISIMPCVAKKAEANNELVFDDFSGKEVDLVISATELTKLIKSANLAYDLLEPQPFDELLQTSSGAANLFGFSGGVLEAALRSVYYELSGQHLDLGSFKLATPTSHHEIVSQELIIGGRLIRVAIVSSLKTANRLIEEIKQGLVHYDFVEVMACPGGCINGGGQPSNEPDLITLRKNQLRHLDKRNHIRYSYLNPQIINLYEEYLVEPNSELAKQLLHIHHD